MNKYSIVPEFSYCKYFPFLAVVCQLITIGLIVFGIFIASPCLILACCFQFCSLYYAGLFICNRYYRLNISSDSITVWYLFNKSKKFCTNEMRWKIRRIPWYNSYFIILHSSRRIPIAIIKPHWKNALRIIHLPHSGKLSSAELKYLKFLKDIGLLRKIDVRCVPDSQYN